VVFARPGLGTLLIKSLSQHDYPVVQACLLMLAMAVMLGTRRHPAGRDGPAGAGGADMIAPVRARAAAARGLAGLWLLW
jgi:hypothetical protein